MLGCPEFLRVRHARRTLRTQRAAKPDLAEIGRLEFEIYGRVLTEEAAIAMVLPPDRMTFLGAAELRRQVDILMGRT